MATKALTAGWPNSNDNNDTSNTTISSNRSHIVNSNHTNSSKPNHANSSDHTIHN